MSGFDDYLNAAPAASAKPSFDQYLGAAQVAPAPVQAAPGTPPSQPAGQSNPPPLGGFLTGVGDVAKGTAQGIVHGLSWAADKIAPDSQFAQDARAALPQMQKTIDQQNLAYDQSRSGGGVLAGAPAPGIDWGRLSGNAAGTLPVMAMGGGQGVLGRIGMGAVQGATTAGMMPTTGNSNQSYAQQKATQMGIGASLGAAVPAGFSGARAFGNGLWNVAQPVIQPGRFVGQGLANAMEPVEAAAAAANIRNAPQFVPGSIPTTAQAAQTPVMVQTEKAAANIPAFKAAAVQRASDNNIARWQALNGVAQDQTALDAATQARSAAAGPLYDAAHQAQTNVGPAFMRYAQIPEMQEAMQRAHSNAALDAAVGRGVAPVWPTPPIPGVSPGSRAINGAALDYTSRALDDMIGDAQRAGNNSRATSLQALQQRVDSWTQSYIPGVRQASDTYADMSVPVNTMEAGQQIANKLGTKSMIPGIGGGVAELQLNPYRTALTTAMNSGNPAKYGIDANALGTLQGIGQDLQRQSLSNSIKSPGSDTAYNLAANGWLARQIYGPAFGGSTALGRTIAGLGTAMAGHPWAGAGIAGGMGRIGQTVGGRLQDRLSGLLLNPDTVLPYLDARAASATQAAPNPLVQGLLNYGRPAITNGLAGGLVNPNH